MDEVYLIMDDMFNVGNIQSSGRHIGGYKEAMSVLREPAVQVIWLVLLTGSYCQHRWTQDMIIRRGGFHYWYVCTVQ